MAFFRRPAQLTAMHWSTADRVEVWFRVSKVDQILKRAVLSRAQADLPRPGGAGGGVVDLLIELMSCYLFLPSSPPLAAYGVGDGKWSMRSQQQATTAGGRVLPALPGDWRRNARVSGRGHTSGAAVRGSVGVQCVQDVRP